MAPQPPAFSSRFQALVATRRLVLDDEHEVYPRAGGPQLGTIVPDPDRPDRWKFVAVPARTPEDLHPLAREIGTLILFLEERPVSPRFEAWNATHGPSSAARKELS